MIIDKYKLLFVSACNSDTLTSISININKNNIETAPIYTNKYDNPMKFRPINIRYIDIVKNRPIRYSTDIIGFLLIITRIPDNIANNVNKSKLLSKNPLL
jgi:hypothetical protein